MKKEIEGFKALIGDDGRAYAVTMFVAASEALAKLEKAIHNADNYAELREHVRNIHRDLKLPLDSVAKQILAVEAEEERNGEDDAETVSPAQGA
jgi:hypothetical protein